MRLTTLLFAGFFGVGIFNMWVDGVLGWRSTLFVAGLAPLSSRRAFHGR